MKNLLYAITVLLFTGCSVKLLMPTQSDIDRVQEKYPNYTLDELNHGKDLYVQHCSACHGLKKPASRSEEKWKKIVPEMVEKANKKKTVISEKDKEDILKYLITMSSAPKPKK